MSSFGPHFTTGAVCGILGSITSYIFIQEPNIMLYGIPCLAGIIGSLTPDMDIKSKSSQIMYLLFASLAGYLWYLDKYNLAIITLLYSIIPQFFKHRGFIHSSFYGLISSGFLLIVFHKMIGFDIKISLAIVITYFLGFLSHLILDK